MALPATQVWKLQLREIRLPFRVNDGVGIRFLLLIRLKSVLFCHQSWELVEESVSSDKVRRVGSKTLSPLHMCTSRLVKLTDSLS